jgi:hypothetical protein
MPEAFVRVIDSLTRDLSEADPKRLGVTTLINPPRIRILTTRHWNEISEDYSDHIWRVLGNAIHYVLLNTENHQNLVEQKIEKLIDGITIVAKPDLYEDKDKSVQDWKVTSVWAVKFKDKQDWADQLNPYAYFLKGAGFPVEKLYINAILKDWRRSEARKYPDYPKIPFVRLEIPLWTTEQTEKFIKDKIKEYKIAINLADEELPVCTPKERWAKEDVYALYKGTNKTATKLFDTEKEALEYAKADTKNKYRVDKRTGADMRCNDYCLVKNFCSYYKETYEKKV